MRDKKPTPPRAERRTHTVTQLGQTRSDPYAWLRADNWQEVMRDPSVLPADIRAYLEAENVFTETALEADLEPLCQTLFAEMRGRIKEDVSTVPQKDGEWAYASRYREGGEYPLYYRVPAEMEDGPETLLFDGDKEAKDKDYFDLGDIEHSPDHTKLAWSVDSKGSEYYDIYVRDIETGEACTSAIKKSTGDFVWSKDSSIIYWGKRDENGRASSVWRRVLAEPDDTLIYTETDPAFSVSVSYSDSGEYVLLYVGSHTTSEVYYFSRDVEDVPKPVCLARRQTDHDYSVSEWQGRWIIRTNKDGAVDFKLMQANIGDTSSEAWTDYLPHEAGRLILSVEAFESYLVREERVDGLPQIVITHANGESHSINMAEPAYELDVISGYEYNTVTLRYSYSSPTTPDRIYDYNMETRQSELRKAREIPSGHNTDDYIVERKMAPGHDGVEIPLTILRHEDTKCDGNAPVLLYGYGSYGLTIPARFGTSRLSLVDRGFIFVIAHIRGGMSKGYNWYLDGKLDKKPNTFKDYLSAADFLISQSYTRKGKIVGHGGSAGGLLMGAVANMRPELFAGIIADVPFVDVLNTMSDGELPLTPPEWPEWGNPLEDLDAYETILGYSPYDQVTGKNYPPILITGGLTDPRVTYWEPAKWIAKLRHEAPEGGPYYLKMNMDSGHGGASGRFESLKELSLLYAFALKMTNSV